MNIRAGLGESILQTQYKKISKIHNPTSGYASGLHCLCLLHSLAVSVDTGGNKDIIDSGVNYAVNSFVVQRHSFCVATTWPARLRRKSL